MIVNFATASGLDIESGASLCDVLWHVVQSTLACDDVECLRLLHRRVARDAAECHHSEAIMEIDEALEVVDHMDLKQFDQAKKDAANKLSSATAFKSEYRQRAAAVGAASASSKKGRKASAVAKIPFPHHCTQAEAKRLLPPNASVWRSLVRGEWCGHYPLHRRVTEPFVRNGS